MNQKIFEKRLRDRGHTVKLTENGLECFNEYDKDPHYYDVILMDLDMPGTLFNVC